MTSSEFKNGIGDVLRVITFRFQGKIHAHAGPDATVFVGFSQGLGDEWFVNVGFWIAALTGEVPKTVEKTHLYFRLERLFPQFREAILTAGALNDPAQPGAHATLCAALKSDIGPALKRLTTAEGLKAAYSGGQLSNGLVTQQAREFLTRL